MHIANCPECGWQREYAEYRNAWRGQRRHQARGCRPDTRGGNSTTGGTTLRNRAAARDRDALAAVGLRGERTVAEWMAHPYALDDLFRVLSGTRLEAITAERAKLRRKAG